MATQSVWTSLRPVSKKKLFAVEVCRILWLPARNVKSVKITTLQECSQYNSAQDFSQTRRLNFYSHGLLNCNPRPSCKFHRKLSAQTVSIRQAAHFQCSPSSDSTGNWFKTNIVDCCSELRSSRTYTTAALQAENLGAIPFNFSRIELRNLSAPQACNKALLLARNCIQAGHGKVIICWKCNEVITSNDFFCRQCNGIQPPLADITYFELFNCPTSYDINTDELTQQFRQLQAKLHPDKFSQSSKQGGQKDKKKVIKEEQDHSAEQSSVVNKAYRTLLDPLSRGIYLLELNSNPLEEDNTSSDPEFLMEILEINETLADIDSVSSLERFEETNKSCINNATEQASQAFKNEDYELAKSWIVKLQYYRNIQDTIKEKRFNLSR